MEKRQRYLGLCIPKSFGQKYWEVTWETWVLEWTDLHSYSTRAVWASVTDGAVFCSEDTSGNRVEKVSALTELTTGTGFPGGAVVKNPPASVGDATDSVLISGSGRAPGVGTGNPLQYSCLENSMRFFVLFCFLAGYNLWNHIESDTTKQLSMRAHGDGEVGGREEHLV